MLSHKWVLGAIAQFGRQFEAPAQSQFTDGIVAAAADRDAQVDDAVRIGEEDVAKTLAGEPELFGHVGQFPIAPFRYQFAHIAGQE